VDEILDGIFHWTAFHEGIRMDVSSYYVAHESFALIDPMLPDDGLEWFERRQAPERILLTNRHHYRHSARFVEAFDCPVYCHEAGLHEFEGGPAVEGFAFGEEVAPSIVALEVDAICPEDSSLHISASGGALAFADGLVRFRDDSLAFVPDSLMDDPETVKRGLRESLRSLLERDFDSLLFAHGLPLVGGAKSALTAFVEADTSS
jgi:glyoxylase-like metal-dependent hydrolase (beta-lactamase superfamily II)